LLLQRSGPNVNGGGTISPTVHKQNGEGSQVYIGIGWSRDCRSSCRGVLCSHVWPVKQRATGFSSANDFFLGGARSARRPARWSRPPRRGVSHFLEQRRALCDELILAGSVFHSHPCRPDICKIGYRFGLHLEVPEMSWSACFITPVIRSPISRCLL
jgi:hypothetical protein